LRESAAGDELDDQDGDSLWNMMKGIPSEIELAWTAFAGSGAVSGTVIVSDVEAAIRDS
jgi:hypothetical protein